MTVSTAACWNAAQVSVICSSVRSDASRGKVRSRPRPWGLPRTWYRTAVLIPENEKSRESGSSIVRGKRRFFGCGVFCARLSTIGPPG